MWGKKLNKINYETNTTCIIANDSFPRLIQRSACTHLEGLSREESEVGDAGSGAFPESALTSALVFGTVLWSADGSVGGGEGSAAVWSGETEASGVSASTWYGGGDVDGNDDWDDEDDDRGSVGAGSCWSELGSDSDCCVSGTTCTSSTTCSTIFTALKEQQEIRLIKISVSEWFHVEE